MDISDPNRHFQVLLKSPYQGECDTSFSDKVSVCKTKRRSCITRDAGSPLNMMLKY
jgi:hypothetical protein